MIPGYLLMLIGIYIVGVGFLMLSLIRRYATTSEIGVAPKEQCCSVERTDEIIKLLTTMHGEINKRFDTVEADIKHIRSDHSFMDKRVETGFEGVREAIINLDVSTKEISDSDMKANIHQNILITRARIVERTLRRNRELVPFDYSDMYTFDKLRKASEN